MTANKQRGEIEFEVNGEKYKLCLTLGALAEIEESLGIDDITKIQDRFTSPKVSDLNKIILALLHGGGHEEMTLKDFMRWPLNVQQLTKVIGDVITASGLGEGEDKGSKK